MKRILVLILFLIVYNGYTQNYNWIQPNTPYLKLYVTDDGIYRINKIDFINSGINTNNIDPRTVKVYYKGSQIPIYFYGELDGVFNDTDYFDFFGQRNYGGSTISYKDSIGTNIPYYATDEYYNLYSDTSVYWIGWGGNNGLRYIIATGTSLVNYFPNYFYKQIHFERDLVYSLGEHVSDVDYRIFNNEKIQGEGWYWADMPKNSSISDTVRLPFLYDSPQLCSLKIFAYPNSYSTSYNYEHRLVFRVNNNYVDTVFSNHYARVDTTITFSSSLLSSALLNQVSVLYTNPFLYSGHMYYDYFRLYYPRKFEFENNEISFFISTTDSSTKTFRIKGFLATNEVNIYDYQNGYRISNYSINSDTLKFSGKQNGKFWISNKYITKKPFRIKQKQVPDLLSTSNTCEYMIVYNKIFEIYAEQLRQHRTSYDSLRTFKTEIEDIYDIFNFGMEHPVAVKNFMHYVYDNWTVPKVKYLCLFGRGSLDPKKIMPGSDYYQNLIPVYGNPPADGYLVNFIPNGFTYYQQIAVGRLPAYNISEAQTMVNNIIAYDNQTPDRWVKNFIFITGGQDTLEQRQFAIQSNYFIDSYIMPCPVAGFPVKIYRNDSSGYITYNYQDSIVHSINRGAIIVNYIGHAANTSWENGIEDPNILNNGTKQPYIFSMTCFTGKNAESNFRSLGELFLQYPNKGSIGFVGTTGWSFKGTGNLLNEYLLKSFTFDSLRKTGLILQKSLGYLVPDSSSFAVRNTINCYNLIGDPASKLLMPSYPEFDIQLSDFKLSNPYPSLRENIVLTIYPKNLGVCADSCKIRFQLIKNNLNYKIKDTIFYTFKFIDTINYSFSLDSIGLYNMKIRLDQDNWYPLERKTNNEISIPIVLKNISFTPIKPVDNIVINTDSIDFLGLNPNINLLNNSVKLFLQIDTSIIFSSPISQTYFNNNPVGVFTKFRVGLPVKDTSTVFYWRMNSINNSDTTGWSEIRRFIYNPLLYSENLKISKDFSNTKIKTLPDSVVLMYRKKPGQYNITELNNTVFNKDSVKLKNYIGEIFVQSNEIFAWAPSLVRINNREVSLLSDAYRGLNLFKVRKLDGVIEDIRNFKINTPQSSDSVVSFLNTFDTTKILLVCKVYITPGGAILSQVARDKIKQFGSTYVDSVGIFSWYNTWSMIGFLNAPNSSIAEKFIYYPGGGQDPDPAISTMSRNFYFINGTIQNIINQAQHWYYFSWDQIINPFTNIKYNVYGIDRNQNQVLLFQNLTNNLSVNLDTLNSYTYPGLNLTANLNIDTVFGFTSPVYKSLKLKYQPPAEIVPDNYSFVLSDSIVNEGDSLKIQLKCYNVGYSNVNTIINKWSASSPNGNVLLKQDTLNNLLSSENFVNVSVAFKTKNLRNPLKIRDTINVFYEVSLPNGRNEFYPYNNLAVTKFIIIGDTLRPRLDVSYDGTKLLNGDFVQSKPYIKVLLYDNSQLMINDTTNVKIYLDGVYVPYKNNPDIEIIYSGKSEILHATVNYHPTLSEGEHRFDYAAIDASNNKADTISNTLIVSSNFKIYDLVNYPNPLKNETHFLFRLSGSYPPSSAKIKIYTVVGRLIKSINFNATIGYNDIYWDARDEEGESIANGIYLYKLIIDNKSKKETSVQKLVILK
jgi:hypothetical protein